MLFGLTLMLSFVFAHEIVLGWKNNDEWCWVNRYSLDPGCIPHLTRIASRFTLTLSRIKLLTEDEGMNETQLFFLRSGHQDEVSARSLALCCDLLTTVCQTAIRVCDDALESHLQVIVGTLTAQVTEQTTISQQVVFHCHCLSLLS